MTTTAPAAAPATVDQLVPPPWSRRARLVAVLTVVVVLAIAGLLWRSGLLGPNLAPVSGYGYGAVGEDVVEGADGTRSGTVELELELTNQGALPLGDVVVSGPPLGGASFGQPGGPVDLRPRTSANVTLHLVIEDCSRFQAPSDPRLSYDATGGLVPARGRTLRFLGGEEPITPTWESDHAGVSSWWYRLAQPVCDPDAFLGL